MSTCCLRVGFITRIDKSPREEGSFLRECALFHPLLTAGFSEACVGLVNQVSQIPASGENTENLSLSVPSSLGGEVSVLKFRLFCILTRVKFQFCYPKTSS